MAECPLCGKQITSLVLAQTVSTKTTMSYNASYDRDADSITTTHMEDQDETDFYDILDEAYYCPECGGGVADGIDDATEILKGGKQ